MMESRRGDPTKFWNREKEWLKKYPQAEHNVILLCTAPIRVERARVVDELSRRKGRSEEASGRDRVTGRTYDEVK